MHMILQVAEGLRTLILGLYTKHLAPDGRGVDYASLAHDPGFRDYVTASSELTKVPCMASNPVHSGAFCKYCILASLQ